MQNLALISTRLNHTFLALLGAGLISSLVEGCSSAPRPADDGSAGDVPTVETSRDAAVDAADGVRPCVRGERPAYPPGPYAIAAQTTLPDMRFVADDGRTVTLGAYHDPCASTPRLLVVRTFAAWSGPSRWYAEHTGALRARPDASRLVVLDLLALVATNLPAAVRDLASWRARYDTPPDALAADPDYRFKEAYLGAGQLPLVMLVDTRTMRVEHIATQPMSDELDQEITRALARVDGRPPPRLPTPVRYDGRFSPDQWDMIRAMSPVPAPPPDPTNAHADDPAAAALGRSLFSDASLSPAGTVSCATCHAPDRAFSDGRPTGLGVARGDRNTPSVLFAAHLRWQFWDGRADTLWSQALGPCENPGEMNSSRLFIAHAVAARYGDAYRAVFGPLPPLQDSGRFPASGRPGDRSWTAMTPADQDAATRVFVNVGKAIAAFERTLRARPAPIDAYAAGDLSALTPRARDGLSRWFEAGCIQCHHGPLLTDDSFHNIEMATGRVDGAPDRGRIDAVAQLLASPFRANGPFSDAPAMAAHLLELAPNDSMLGQFHTPSLRVTAATGPWGHGGTFSELERVVLHYAQLGMMPATGTIGTRDLHLPNFHRSAEYVGSLVDVMRALSADPPLP